MPNSSTTPSSGASAPVRTVGDELLDYLLLEGVTQIFGVPGAGIAHLLQRIHNRPEFTFVNCRHESAAAYQADGYFRATGSPGVVLVTSGPGATNALTGVMNAHFAGSAVLVITGEVAQMYLGRGYLQEGTDCGLNIHDIFGAATRYSADIEDPVSASTIIEQAFRVMMSLPRGAAHLGISDNVAASPAAVFNPDKPQSFLAPRPPASTSAYRAAPAGATEDSVRRTLAVLSSAQRPLMLLGAGCRDALRNPETARALKCLVEHWQIPVMTTSDGKGVFPEDHALSLRAYGFSGCAWPQYWMVGDDGKAAHDALVVVGSSLGELGTYKWNPMLVPNGPFLQVDIDPSMIGRGFPITDGFVGEAGAFLRALWEQAPAWPCDPNEVAARGQAVAAIKAANPPMASPTDYASESAPIQPAALCRVLNELIADGTMFFIDCGNCVGWSLNCITIAEGREFHSALAMGPMGCGFGGALGARYGAPDRPVVALIGDGSFLMHAGEVSTAAAHKVGVIWVVLNDNQLSMVSQGMDFLFKTDPPYATDYELGAPDLVKVAEGLGADATVVNQPSDLVAAWAGIVQNADQGRPQVIVANIDPKAAPPYWNPPYWQPVSD